MHSECEQAQRTIRAGGLLKKVEVEQTVEDTPRNVTTSCVRRKGGGYCERATTGSSYAKRRFRYSKKLGRTFVAPNILPWESRELTIMLAPLKHPCTV